MTVLNDFKRWLCGCPSRKRNAGRPPLREMPVPEEVRHASHALNNAASILQGAVLNLRKQADALAELSDEMQGNGR
jgi:hypothetical protein